MHMHDILISRCHFSKQPSHAPPIAPKALATATYHVIIKIIEAGVAVAMAEEAAAAVVYVIAATDVAAAW